MSILMRAPRDVVEKKPPHGSPCNNCGLCCLMSLCPLARHIFGGPGSGEIRGPCPALARNISGGFVCGVVNDPARFVVDETVLTHGVEKLRAAAEVLIGAGLGCDSRINGEPINHAFNDRLRENDRLTITERREAVRMWGLKP